MNLLFSFLGYVGKLFFYFLFNKPSNQNYFWKTYLKKQENIFFTNSSKKISKYKYFDNILIGSAWKNIFLLAVPTSEFSKHKKLLRILSNYGTHTLTFSSIYA